MKSVVLFAAVLLTGLVSSAEAGQGWYLMAPQQVGDPVSQWDVDDTFIHLSECKDKKVTERERLKKFSDAVPSDKVARNLLWRWVNAQCVATDDPRLAR